METEPQTIPWQLLKMDGRDSYLESESEYAARLLQVLAESGIDPGQILIAGIDAEPIERTGTFGDRVTTFAVTTDELIQAAQEVDAYGSSSFENPLHYADELLKAPDEPQRHAVAAFDANSFEPVTSNENPDGIVLDGDTNWQLKPGVTMDDAVRAVVEIL